MVLSSPRYRRGVTLLEVLISVFILIIGMLSVAALLPVAAHQMNVAQKLDRGAALGQAAFHDLKVRGYLNPQSWLLNQEGTGGTPEPIRAVDLSTGTFQTVPATVDADTRYDPFPQPPFITGGTPGPMSPPFVIDPLWVSHPQRIASGEARQVATFPKHDNNRRIDVPAPGSPPIPRLTLISRFDGSNLPVAMSYQQAERIFRGNDDLVYDIPSEERFRPQGIFSRDNSNNPVAQQFEGDFSWFVTVAPDLNALASASDVTALKKYTASVAVVYRRALVEEAYSPTQPTIGESMVYVDIGPGGISGGRVRLRLPDTNLNRFNKVKPNQWIMLSGWVTVDTTIPPAVPRFAPDYLTDAAYPGVQWPYLAWYRVVGISDVYTDTVDGERVRDVTLEGPQIGPRSTATVPFVDITDSDDHTWDPVNGDYGLTIYATIVDEVVSVYTKTIVLDTTSPWSR